MRIGNIFTKIATSKGGQNFYKKLLDPKNDNFCNQFLPVVETGLISSFYVLSTAVQKKIDEDSKKALQIQNLLSFAASVAISIPLNKKVSKMGEQIIEKLNPELIPDAHKVTAGIRVGLPIMTSILVSRFLVAVALVPLSSKIRDFVKSKKEESSLNKIA